MRWSRVWACIAVAWLAPLAWLALTLSMRPSDGTLVSSPTAFLGAGRWDDGVEVLETYGRTPLQQGDQVLAIGGRDLADWLADGPDLAPRRGDVLTYRFVRPGSGLDRIQTVDVALEGYPVGAAVRENLYQVVLGLGLLASGSLLLLRRARRTASVSGVRGIPPP